MHVPVQATADAMASKDVAGLGGAAFFNDGSAVWFQLRIHLADAQSTWGWIGDDMQKHIAAWELLAEFALSYCIESHLPNSRGPIACHQANDNSAAHAAPAKRLTMTKALAVVLAPYFTFTRRLHFYPHLSYPWVPGHLNVLAVELSRFKQPLSLHLDPNGFYAIPWRDLLQLPGILVAQHGPKWPSHFNIQQRKKELLQSADWVPQSISLLGSSYSGRSIFVRVWCLVNSPPLYIDLNMPRLLGCLVVL